MNDLKRLPLLLLALALGCAGGGTGPDGGEYCNSDLGCDDTFDCTIDTCGVNNLCRHDEIDERCPSGQVCESGRGCVASASCDTDAECDDAIDCTIDSCGAGNICNHIAVNERCAAGETCDVATGCMTASGCASDADCNDSIDCTRDVCNADRSCTHNALNELCDTTAGERCHETRGCYLPMPCTTAADCDDGDFCNGAEVCTTEFGCEPAPMPRMCDDSDDCTLDSCDPAAGTGGMCVFACDASRPECDCPVTGPSCSGRFTLSPAIVDSCAGGMVDYDMGEVTFEVVAGVLTATPRRAHFTSLSDTASPVCPNFMATAVVTGGTTERFTLQGTFSDDDNFTGSFTADYGGIGSIVGCQEGTMPVTGTRAP